jgi:O-antigen ligase
VVRLVRGRATPAGRGKLAVSCVALAAVAVLLATTDATPLGRHNAIQRSIGDATSAASDRERLPQIESSLRTIAGQPLTGAGFEDVLDAHNVYVQLWAGAGVLGLFGFLLAAGTVLRAGCRPRRGTPPHLLSSAFVAGYAGYLVAGTVQNFLWERYLWLHVAVILWVGVEGQRAASELDRPVSQLPTADEAEDEQRSA